MKFGEVRLSPWAWEAPVANTLLFLVVAGSQDVVASAQVPNPCSATLLPAREAGGRFLNLAKT